MTRQEAGPRGLHPDATPKRILYQEQDNSLVRPRQTARCELHAVNLVHKLPPRCPLATSNPLETLARLQDAAWRVIGRGVHDPELPNALALLDAKDVCMACSERILTHATVRRLRARKAVAA